MSTLASRFPDAIFSIGRGGLKKMALSALEGSAEIYLHGAHIVSFVPSGQRQVLWMSGQSEFADKKAIRGGIPVCFPWFGPHSDNQDYPSHGVARLREWSVESVRRLPEGAVEAKLSLDSDADSLAMWPFPFQLILTVTVAHSLSVDLEVRNTGPGPFIFTEALHTYFGVSNIQSVEVTGLDGVEYVDKVGPGGGRVVQTGPIRFIGETDRPYLDTQEPCSIVDQGFGRIIKIEKHGSRTSVVWNPWKNKAQRMPDFGDDEWPGMLCLETANALSNTVTVQAGRSHIMGMSISVTGL